MRSVDRQRLETRRPPAPGARIRIAPPDRTAPATGAALPVPRPDSAAVRVGPRPRATAPAAHAWFWRAHSPRRTAAGPARWARALDTLRTRRETVGALYHGEWMAEIRRTWGETARRAARRHGVSDALLLAMIAVESAGRPGARSHKGAQGLMQLIPATARRFGVRDAYDPRQNIDGGAAYLSWLLGRFDGDPILALAGYNAGEGSVDRHRGVPPYKETRAYVVKVLDALVAAEHLCAAPPPSPRHVCEPRPAPVRDTPGKDTPGNPPGDGT